MISHQQDQLLLMRFPLTSRGVLLLDKLQLCMLLSLEQEATGTFETELTLAPEMGFALSTCTEVVFKIGDTKFNGRSRWTESTAATT